MDDKDFRQAMKWYRSAPVTHVAPETGSLAAPQKKDIAHREKARVWFPRQTPADSALQQESADEMLPEEQPEDTMQGAVTVYREKKVAAYGRMEKVDAPEAMDAPDVPLADAMSADNPPCDVDYRAVPDGEVLQLGMDGEPAVAGEAPAADSPFEDMIASVEAGLASMLAEGPPVADEGPAAENNADDETATLLAGMSEEERAEIAGFDLSLLREDAPEDAAQAASPEEALLAGMSEEERAEIAGFDPVLLADVPDETGQAEAAAEEAAEENAVATGEEPAAAAEEALLTGAQDTSVPEGAAMMPDAALTEEAVPAVGVAGLSGEAVAAGEADVHEAMQDEPETAVEAAEEQTSAEDAALAGALEAVAAGEAFSGEDEPLQAAGAFQETGLPEEDGAADGGAPVADGALAGADEGMGEETAPAVDADVTKQVPDLPDMRHAPEPEDAALPAGEAVFSQAAEMTGLAEEDESGQAETGKAALLHGTVSAEADTLPDAEAAQAAIEEDEAQAVEALHDAGGDNPPDTGAVGLFAETAEEEPVADNAFAGVTAREGEAVQGEPDMPEAGDSAAPATDGDEMLPVEAGSAEADAPEAGAILPDRQGAAEPETVFGEFEAEAAPAGEAFPGEAEALSAVGIAPERVEKEPVADDAFSGATASEGEATGTAVKAGPETAIDADMAASEAEVVSVPEPGGEAAEMAAEEKTAEVDTVAATDASADGAAAWAGVAEAEQPVQAAAEQEAMPDVPVMPEAGDGGDAGELEEGLPVEASAEADASEATLEEEITGEAEGAQAEAVPAAGEAFSGEPGAVHVAVAVPETAGEEPVADDAFAGAATSEGEAAEAIAQDEPETAIEASGAEVASVPDPDGKTAETAAEEKAAEADAIATEAEPADDAAAQAAVSETAQPVQAAAVTEEMPGEPSMPEASGNGAPASDGEDANKLEAAVVAAETAEPTEEAADGISAGAGVLPDPETALADGILLAEGESLPAAPVSVPDGMPAEPKGVIPEEDIFRDKMRNHQRNRMAFAEYKVAAAYAREGTDAAYQEAIKWYTRAAEKGHAVSRFNLGNIYYAGRGVAQDYAKAADWYELAARQGVARAQDNLGLMFFHGRGRPVEPETAVYWFRQAAIQGYAPAQYKLAIHLEAGVGVASNRAEALYWYRKAASQGDARAQKEAARLEEEAAR